MPEPPESHTESVAPRILRDTRAEIDLQAIGSNVRAINSLLHGAVFMAVVKGNAYGHGSVSIARTAAEHGAAWLGVYTVQEGVELRAAGLTLPILVFGAFNAAEAAAICAYCLTPTISSLCGARWIQDCSSNRSIPFHVKIDTGLHRSGLELKEARELLRAISGFPCLKPQGLYTHFARADEPGCPETAQQLSEFAAATRVLRDDGWDFPMRHTANSAATLSRPDTHLDMVRVGISIYGYTPAPAVTGAVRLTPALTLRSLVTRVHDIPAGQGVGYGYRFKAGRASTIALVPIGYGDGLPRRLGEGRGTVLIRGKTAPIIGKVSMDQITVDVTDIQNLSVGDEVILIGRQADCVQDAHLLAAQADTICYDVLTSLLPRVPRVYADGPTRPGAGFLPRHVQITS